MLGVTSFGVAEHYPAAARPADLRVDNAPAILTGDGELFLEAEGRHEEVDEGPGVLAAGRRPHHRAATIGADHGETIR